MIDEKLKASGLTMTEFIIRAITGKPVVSIPNVGEILTELKRQGNNLNQLAKANYFGMTTEEELLSALAEIKKLYAYILSAIGGEECVGSYMQLSAGDGIYRIDNDVTLPVR